MNQQDLKIPIPNLNIYSKEEQNEIFEYLKQLDETQMKTYLIAIKHLGSSFNIYRSNGFKEWRTKKF